MNRGNETMKRTLLLTLVIAGGFAFAGVPSLSFMTPDSAQAAETTKSKKKKVVKKETTKKKKGDCGYPEPPNPAGMSDYCAYQYNIYCRRGVGCNKYGRDFMSWDD
jgi:hypothetical protein